MDPHQLWSQRELSARIRREARRRWIRRSIIAGAAMVALLAALAVSLLARHHDTSAGHPTSTPPPSATVIASYIWTQLHPSGQQPAPRAGGHVVWTGRELLVFGGYRDGDHCCLQDLTAYNPQRNSWLARAAGPARAGGAAVWDGHEILLYGGTAPMPDNSMWQYDPTSNRWARVTTSGQGPLPEDVGSAVWDGHQMIVLAFPGTRPLGTMWAYDPRRRRWSSILTRGAMPRSLQDTNAVWDGRELLLTTQSAGAFAYAPATHSWAALSPSSKLQVHANATVWDGTELLSVGGADPSNVEQSAVWRLARDMSGTWNWTAVDTGGVPFPARAGAAGAWDGQQALIFGGGEANATNELWSLRPSVPIVSVSATSDHGHTVHPLDTIDYSIFVRNTGPEPAQHVHVTATLPGTASYLGGSTTRDGANVPDAPGGRSALQDGLDLGTVPARAQVKLTLAMQVSSRAANGDSFGLEIAALSQGNPAAAQAEVPQVVVVALSPTDTPVPPTGTARSTATTPGTTPAHGLANPATARPIAPPRPTAMHVPTAAAPTNSGRADQLVRNAAAALARAIADLPTITPTPTASATPQSTATQRPTATNAPTATAVPTGTPVPSSTPPPTRTPTATPMPTRSPFPTVTPVPSGTPVPTPPAPTLTPVPTAPPPPTVTPVPTSGVSGSSPEPAATNVPDGAGVGTATPSTVTAPPVLPTSEPSATAIATALPSDTPAATSTAIPG